MKASITAFFTVLLNLHRSGWLMIFMIMPGVMVTANSAYASKPSMDVIMIVENTAAIKQLDPDQKRKTAARVFLSILDETDRAAVISFSGDGHALTNLMELNTEKNVSQLLSAIDKLSGKGQLVNLPAALEAAKRVIEKSTLSNGREIHVVMLTRGETNPADATASKQAQDESLNQLLLWFKTSYIPIHIITLGNTTEDTSTKNITAITEGSFIKSNTADLLIPAFRDMHSVIKSEDVYAITNRSFKVDESMDYFKLLVIPNNSSMKLITPSGNTITAENDTTKTLWKAANDFTAINVKEPETGTWKINANNFSATNATLHYPDTMRIHYQIGHDNIKNGENIKVTAWLEKNNQTITDSAIIQFIQVRLQLRLDGKIVDNISLFPEKDLPGRFFTHIQLDQAGEYQFQLSMEDNNLYRETRFIQNIIPQSINSPAQTQANSRKTSQTTEAATADDPEATEAVTQQAGEELTGFSTKLTETFPHLGQALVIITSINGILIVIGGVFYSRQRMRQQAADTFKFVKSSNKDKENYKATNYEDAAA